MLRTCSGYLGCWIHIFKELETMSPIQFHLPSALDQSRTCNKHINIPQQSQPELRAGLAEGTARADSTMEQSPKFLAGLTSTSSMTIALLQSWN